MFSALYAAFRTLRRAPAFAAATVLTLGLGIGATTALFTAVRGILLRSLPYLGAGQIVQISEVNRSLKPTRVTEPNFFDWRRSARTLRAVAEYYADGSIVLGGGEAQKVASATVSRDFFNVFAVRPVIGRAFTPDEQQPGGAPAVIVGDALWRSLGWSSAALGHRTLIVDGTPTQVIGVMPAGFDFPNRAELWKASELAAPNESRTAHNWDVVARLAPGVTQAQAQQELSTITRALQREYRDRMDAIDAAVVPLHEALVGSQRGPLLLLFAGASVLLLVAATNVATLLTARAESQRRELGIRLAVGATAGRLARQFVAESGIVAGAGAVLGLVIALLGTRFLTAAGDIAGLPRPDAVRVDTLVVGFAFGVAALATGGIGGAVAIRAVREADAGGVALITGERAGTVGRGGARVRSTLVAAQVALTAVLLVGAGLLARSFVQLVTVDPGFRTEHAVVVSLALPGAPEGDTSGYARTRQTVDAVLAQLRALPGVRAAGGVTRLPIADGEAATGGYLLQNPTDEVKSYADFDRLKVDPARTGTAGFIKVSDGYFEAMGIPLLRGRTFAAGDDAGAPQVAVISASLARTRFAGESPLGRLIQFGNMDGDVHPMRVIGVVGDVRERLNSASGPIVYASARQRGRPWAFTIMVAGDRAAGGPFNEQATVAAARRVVASVAPTFVATVRPISDVFATTLAARRYALLLAGAFAVAALALAVTGLYGIVAFVVAQRRRELGVRVALGATAADVQRLVLGRGLAPAALGLAAGLVAALALGQLLTTQLYEVKPADPLTYAAVTLALGTVALAAAWGPARRAARADPVVALRAE